MVYIFRGAEAGGNHLSLLPGKVLPLKPYCGTCSPPGADTYLSPLRKNSFLGTNRKRESFGIESSAIPEGDEARTFVSTCLASGTKRWSHEGCRKLVPYLLL
jgi:hypothetical protein